MNKEMFEKEFPQEGLGEERQTDVGRLKQEEKKEKDRQTKTENPL